MGEAMGFAMEENVIGNVDSGSEWIQAMKDCS